MSRKTRRQLLVRIGCAGAVGVTGCLGGEGEPQDGQQEGPEDEPGNGSESDPGAGPQEGPAEEGETEPQEGPQEGPDDPPEEGPQEGPTEEPSAEVDTDAVGAVVREFYEGVFRNETDTDTYLHENSTVGADTDRLEDIPPDATIEDVEVTVVEANESGDRVVVEASVAAVSSVEARDITDEIELRKEDGEWKVWGRGKDSGSQTERDGPR